MDRLQQLERGWMIYKLRWFFKHAFIIVMALIVGGGLVYWVANHGKQDRKLEETQEAAVFSSQVPDQKSEPTLPTLAEVKESLPPVMIERVLIKPVFLEPNYDFEQDMAERLGTRVESSAQRTSQATPSVVTRTVGVESLEERFMQTPTYDRAIEIAEHYLRLGAYHEALKWSLEANEIDNEKEQSWAIFATASAQLGRKEQAAESLRAYLRTRTSQRLNALLRELEQ